MIAGIFLGAMIGVAATLLFAMYLGARKPGGTSDGGTTRNNIAAVSVDTSGKGGPSIDAFTARRMNEIFRDYKNGTIQ